MSAADQTEEQRIIAAVKQLKLKDPADKRAVDLLLKQEDELMPSALAWFRSLIARGGSKFDVANP